MANLIYTPSANYAVGIQHRLTALNDFNGTLPPVDNTHHVTLANGLNKFAVNNGGGYFDFENIENVIVQQYMFMFGGAVAWTLSISNRNFDGTAISGETVPIDGGSADAYVAKFSDVHIILGPQQVLLLATTGGVGAMVAQVWASIQRGSQGG